MPWSSSNILLKDSSLDSHIGLHVACYIYSLSSPVWSLVMTPAAKELFSPQDCADWSCSGEEEVLHKAAFMVHPWSSEDIRAVGTRGMSSGCFHWAEEGWGGNEAIRVKMFVFIKNSQRGYFLLDPFNWETDRRDFFISSSLGIRQIIVTRKVWSIMSSPQPPQTNPGKTDEKMELCSTSACFFPKYLKVYFWKAIQHASFVLLSFCTAFIYSIIELLYWFIQFNCVAIHIFIIFFSNHKWLNTAASQGQ